MSDIRRQFLLLRVFTIGFGLIAVFWGASELSSFRSDRSIERIASRIIAGDPFKAETLQNQIRFPAQIEKTSFCRPTALRSEAVVRLRIADAPDGSGSDPVDVRTNAAIDSIRNSLECSPEDSFFWLVLFGLETPAPLSYLRASYRLGPNEGWIALKRNPVAFAKFNQLPDDLRETVLREFRGILEMEFYDDALKILTGPAWDNKEFVLSQLDRVARRHRQGLANRLASAGYQVVVPGIEKENLRR
jgi:hypothetical protein